MATRNHTVLKKFWWAATIEVIHLNPSLKQAKTVQLVHAFIVKVRIAKTTSPSGWSKIRHKKRSPGDSTHISPCPHVLISSEAIATIKHLSEPLSWATALFLVHYPGFGYHGNPPHSTYIPYSQQPRHRLGPVARHNHLAVNEKTQWRKHHQRFLW